MNVARILYPVQVLGPGNRVGIWLCGCSRACKGCSNPELWRRLPEYEVSVDDVFSLVQWIASDHIIDGFTFSGGEPMDQAGELSRLIQLVSSISKDILVYSGYQIEELTSKNDPAIDSALRSIAVLIDGTYVEELNNNAFLRGSSNQRIHVLNKDFEGRYQHYIAEGRNQIQNFTTTDGVVSVGIHHKYF